MNRDLRIGAGFLTAITVLGIGSVALDRKSTVRAATVQAPRFEVDPLWPKPLPNHWLIGNAIGVSVDAQDHIWIVHRAGSLERMETYAQQNPPASECCVAAPPVLEFDEAGNLIGHWGGPGPGTTGPKPITASRSTIKGTSGSAATAGRSRVARPQPAREAPAPPATECPLPEVLPPAATSTTT